MNLRSGEQFTERVCQQSHKRLVERLSTLRVCEIQAVKYGLGDDVIQLLKESLLGSLFKSVIFDERERHIVRCYSIEQELLVLLKLWLRITKLADNVPKSIRDERVRMLELEQFQPVLFLLFFKL